MDYFDRVQRSIDFIESKLTEGVELDDIAHHDVPEFERVHTLYEKDSRLHVPPTIHSYTQMRVQTINLGIP